MAKKKNRQSPQSEAHTIRKPSEFSEAPTLASDDTSAEIEQAMSLLESIKVQVAQLEEMLLKLQTDGGESTGSADPSGHSRMHPNLNDLSAIVEISQGLSDLQPLDSGRPE